MYQKFLGMYVQARIAPFGYQLSPTMPFHAKNIEEKESRKKEKRDGHIDDKKFRVSKYDKQ